MPASKRKRLASSVDAKKKRKKAAGKIPPTRPPAITGNSGSEFDTPNGIPRELLEKILSNITEPREISKVERVNKTFADIAWKSFRVLNFDRLFRYSDMGEWLGEEKFSSWFPTAWKKAINIRSISLPSIWADWGDMDSEPSVGPFLHQIYKCRLQMPRKIEVFRAAVHSRAVSLHNAYRELIKAWAETLKDLQLGFHPAFRSVLDEPAYCPKTAGQKLARALDRCNALLTFTFHYFPRNEDGDYSPLECLSNMRELRDLTIYFWYDRHCAVVNSLPAVVNSLHALGENKKLASSSGKCGDFLLRLEDSATIGWISETAAAAQLTLDVVTELHIEEIGLSSCDWIAVFQCLPNMKTMKTYKLPKPSPPDEVALFEGLPELTCSNNCKIIQAFLSAYEDAVPPRNLSMAVSKSMPISFNDFKDPRELLLAFKSFGEKAERETGVRGELVRENMENLPGNQRGHVELISLKFVKGAATAVVKHGQICVQL